MDIVLMHGMIRSLYSNRTWWEVDRVKMMRTLIGRKDQLSSLTVS